MPSPAQTTKLSLEPEVGKPTQFQSCTILSLPNELLLRVIALLSTVSIPNLMVNRSLRSVCEQGLYRSISLPRYPRRSIRLLETFLHRPDLALLVRHLEIDFSWLFPGLFPQDQVPSAIQPDGLVALSLAKNLNSLSLAGVASWIWEPEMAKLREAIFKMKLIRLDVPLIRDPHTEYACVWPGDSDIEDDWNGDLGDEIRKLLQAQPLLEEFKFSDSSITYKTSASLRNNLKHSDVPSLKSLQASPHLAMAFLPVANRLESLNLRIEDWDDRLLSDMETKSTAIKLAIRHFTIRVWYHDEWLWSNLAKVFALFPKTEELSVAINSLTTATDVEPASYFFEMVGKNIYHLPSLRHIEVKFETLYPETPGIFEVGTDSLVEYKIACPTLETVVDPAKRLWTFRYNHQGSGDFEHWLVGPLIKERLAPVKDLPAPEGSNSLR
ncbi:hypothetical protein M407DRAFT_24719 [Tulasnella calospora MUT 4182]|uniref:F-box domain-containing protein n=1 Tax=Tulasnella calospora MUT 4182 TaxID=1051891 RepID=A0A0C3QIV5_9AGAM|nr:hypothetical protein M407DRAFT_24719 [Tulasnella calospora MUT 4182]